VLLNILRGTGLSGLAGIPRVRPLSVAATLIRPLLAITRDEVLDYLHSLQQPFREDRTNADTGYTRNRIRHELLPLLAREFNPHIRTALVRLSELAGEAESEWSERLAEAADQAVRPIEHGVELSLAPLASLSDFMTRNLLRTAWRQQGWPEQEMGQEEWRALLSLARAGDSTDDRSPPARMFPGGIRAERTGSVLRLTQRR
jgi:tRNA(Ile)-lysidine synthase